MTKLSNKRSEKRLSVRAYVKKVRIEGRNYHCRAMNISRNGMFLFKAPTHLAKDIRFAWLHFTLPNSTVKICALGEVVYHCDMKGLQGSGVRFKFMFPDQRKALDDYIDRSVRIAA